MAGDPIYLYDRPGLQWLPLPEAKRVNPLSATAVYRLYDDAGLLLYVGVSRRPLADRFNAHSRRCWWQSVAWVAVELRRHEWQALDRERAVIKAERPLFNKRSAVAA